MGSVIKTGLGVLSGEGVQEGPNCIKLDTLSFLVDSGVGVSIGTKGIIVVMLYCGV